MPSESGAEHRFMAMSNSAKGRAALRASGKKPAPMKVAAEFLAADRGKHFKDAYKKRT